MKVIAIEAAGFITINKCYNVIGYGKWSMPDLSEIHNYYTIIDDRNQEVNYETSFFKTLSEIRKEKLKKLEGL